MSIWDPGITRQSTNYRRQCDYVDKMAMHIYQKEKAMVYPSSLGDDIGYAAGQILRCVIASVIFSIIFFEVAKWYTT